jgi:hypothetical protein
VYFLRYISENVSLVVWWCPRSYRASGLSGSGGWSATYHEFLTLGLVLRTKFEAVSSIVSLWLRQFLSLPCRSWCHPRVPLCLCPLPRPPPLCALCPPRKWLVYGLARVVRVCNARSDTGERVELHSEWMQVHLRVVCYRIRQLTTSASNCESCE